MELNKNQKEVVETLSGNIAVIASAGSGKTSVLTLRIKNLVDNNIEPSSILAITFSKKAKETLVNRLKDLIPNKYKDINIETFHSFALKIIKTENPVCNVWLTQWEKEKVLKQICYDMGIGVNKNFPYNEIMSFIGKQKSLMLKPEDDLIFTDEMPFDLGTMKKIFFNFEKYKTDNMLIEFDDFLNIAVDMIQSSPVLQKKLRENIRYILADEYQDISVSQAMLLKLLNEDNTMIVGDPLQAIYSFRGGDSRFILNFDKDYKNVKVVHLNTNYRCGKDIVDLANAFALSVPDSKHRNYVESIAANTTVPKPIVKYFPSDEEEAIKIAQAIQDNEWKYSDIAVLSRTNAQLQRIQNVLNLYDIPFEVVSGSLFIEQKEIKILVSYLLLAYNTDNDEAFSYIWNKPTRFLPNVLLDKISRYSIENKMSMYDCSIIFGKQNKRSESAIRSIHKIICTLQSGDFDNVGEMIGYLRTELNLDYFVSNGEVGEDGKNSEKIENMNTFQNMCTRDKTLEQFSEFINGFNKQKEISDKESVKLLTLHKSKGLEFPIVFIIGCNEGLLPHGKSLNIDDERRLLYVGITRAEKELYLSYVFEYNNKFLEPSRFIKEFKQYANIVGRKEENQNGSK